MFAYACYFKSEASLIQKDGLYVSDPLALHYILVKEMNNYEEIPVVRT